MEPTKGPKPPTNLAIRLPEDVAAMVHRLAYETGRSKRDLVIEALWKTYAPAATGNVRGDGR